MEKSEKLKNFENEIEKEAGIVMAVQNIGVATIGEIIKKLNFYGIKVTEKQTEKACVNLNKRQIFSVDLKEKGQKRYLMRRIGVSVPEIGQIKAIVDAKGKQTEEIRALINELEASKKNAKIAPNNYFDALVSFRTSGKVYGFLPNSEGINCHYRDEENKVIFYKKHFNGWLTKGLPIVNRSSNVITRIYTFSGYTNVRDKLSVEESFVTNVEGTYKGAGRGTKYCEYLPEGTVIKTKFRVPSSLFVPEQFRRALELIGESVSFSGGNKMSHATMKIEEYKVIPNIWMEDAM